MRGSDLTSILMLQILQCLCDATLPEALGLPDTESIEQLREQSFVENLSFSLCMLSDSVAVPSKDFKAIPAKVGE